MAKTVEEILKDEGVIKPVPREPEKVKFEEENVDLKKVVMSIEKLQTEVENLRDFKKQNDEITRELIEKIGEIRSMFFQRDSLIKETETKVKVLDDMVSDINPTKYLKELEKRKEEILESQARVEKLEMIEKDMSNSVNGLKQTLQNIKSVENLEKLLNEVQESVSKNRQLKDDIDRTAGKSERFYFEMENRMKEFSELKAKTDKIEDMSQELTKSVDNINIRLAGFLSKTDIEDFKKSVNSIISSNREYIESKVKEMGSILNLPSDEATARVEQLRKRSSEISSLISNLDNQYKNAFISERTYNEVKQKNEIILKQVEEELNQIQSGQGFSLKNLPSIIKDIENKANSLSVNIGEQGRRADESLKSMESKLSAYVQESTSKSDQLKEEIERLRGVSQTLTKSIENVNTKMESLVSKSDIEELKKDVNGIVSSNKYYVDAKLNEMKSVTDEIEGLHKELTDSVNNLNTKLEDLVSKSEMQKLKESVDGTVSSDRSYVDSEVKEVKIEADKIEGLSKDFKKSLEAVNAKLEGFVPKTDIDNFRNSVKIAVSSNKNYIDGKMREIESSFNLSEGDASRVEQLRKRKSEVSNLLLNIEEQYKKAFISEKTFGEVKQKNDSIMKQIEDELNQIQSGKRFSLKTLPSVISKLEDKTDALDRKLEEQGERLNESLKSAGSDSKLADVTKVVKIQTDMLDDIIKKVKEASDNMSRLSASLNSYDLRIKFFEILDGLVRLDNSKDISYYLTELENLIAGMKANNLWDIHKESTTLSLLGDIAGNWRKYGYNDIARVFDDEITKIKSPENYQYVLKY